MPISTVHSRRQFFRAATLAAGATGLAAAQVPTSHPVLLGAPIFLKSDDPAELAREHTRLGYRAAYCPNANPADSARCKAIETAFQNEGVVIAEVGAWKNMLAPDAAERKANMDYIIERMALAEAVGARCCVTIAGSYNPKVWYGPHPDNFSFEFFDATVENVRKVIDAVKPKRAKFAIEMMGWSIPSGPEEYLRLVQTINSEAFGVHIDVCNGINSPERYYNNAAFTRACFRILGKYVVSCHAKDLQWLPEMNLHFVEVVPGRGDYDYRPLLTELGKLPQQPPLMLEHLKTAEEYTEGVEFIRKVAGEERVKIA
ncbi:MAG: sugar phosphate isomerase/epimerase [Bryobacterales bacterium]|nr:sugar phosphate isomerase/epimerase [Bryobacterales bacterium]